MVLTDRTYGHIKDPRWGNRWNNTSSKVSGWERQFLNDQASFHHNMFSISNVTRFTIFTCVILFGILHHLFLYTYVLVEKNGEKLSSFTRHLEHILHTTSSSKISFLSNRQKPYVWVHLVGPTHSQCYQTNKTYVCLLTSKEKQDRENNLCFFVVPGISLHQSITQIGAGQYHKLIHQATEYVRQDRCIRH